MRNARTGSALAATAPAAAPTVEQHSGPGAAGWTEDQFKILFSALPRGKEADGSMGDDAPPAFVSTLPRSLWDYCKQRFAQVTNPPIDPLRESHVMSLAVHLPNGVVLPSPIIAAGQLAELSATFGPVHRIDFTFPAPMGVSGARCSITQLSTPLSGSGRPGLLPPYRIAASAASARCCRRCWPPRRCGRRWCAMDCGTCR